VTWLVVGGAGGWLLHGYRMAQSELPALATLPQRAAIAHVVYTPEVLHPVEVGVEQEAHLVNWLSKRLGTEVRVPHLQAIGYDLVGGRLLPDQDRPAAQFMYQDAGGRRLTLYVRTQEAHGAEATAFRYSSQEKVAVFYWIDGSVGYALSGEVDKAALLRAAELVYRDLNP
jgi:anti-sigma factor RsiW